ncbi:MAG: 3-hydroxyacyl-ACP dehydratase FabZ family protein [Gemmatimonadales bacterium]
MAAPAGQSGLIDIDATYLPIQQMRQIARVTVLEGATITGEVDLGSEHWVYAQHFPGDPIFPGALIIEAAGQLVALWAWADGQRGRPRLVKTSAEFRAPVEIEDSQIMLDAVVKRKRHLNFADVTVRTQRQVVAGVSMVLAVVPAAGA